jgi:hypothetical protein
MSPPDTTAPIGANVIHLRARLEEAGLSAILDELLPVTILLDDGPDGRWVRIDPTHHVDFIASEGVRLVTSGRIRWVTAGVPIEVTLHSVQLMLHPQIVADSEGHKLVFRASLESADLKNVPALLDRGIVALVNRQLDSRRDQMNWNFEKSLGFAVPLPPALQGVSMLQLGAGGATIEISADHIELALPVSLHFSKADPTLAAV